MSGFNLYQATFEAAEDALLLLQHGRVLDANAAARQLLAGPGEALAGRELADLSPPLQPDGQRSAEGLRARIEAASRGEPQRCYWLFRRSGRGVVHADLRIERLAVAGDGGPILRVVVREQDRAQGRLYALAVDMLGVATLDGRFKELSPSWESTLGFTLGELLARPYAEFIHPEDRARTLSETDAFSTGARTLTYENRFLCKDGSYRWLEWNAMLALDEGLVYFVARDVTRRKSTEQALRESEERMRSLYEGIPHYITVVDRDERIISLNRAPRHKGTEAVLGRPFHELLSPEDHDRISQVIQGVLRTGEPARYESRGGPGCEGSWYESHATAIRMGREVTHVLIVTEDITERRRAEEQRRESEARFHAAVEASMDAFLTMAAERDAAGAAADLVITGLNARAAAMLLRPREELLGRRLSDLRPSLEADALLEKCLRVTRTGKALEEEVRVPGQGERPDAWVLHQIVPLSDGVAVTLRDTTYRKRLEEQLRQSIERLESYAEELEGKNQRLAEENAERERTARLLYEQQEAIRALSTPIIQAWDGVLVLPIIGALDAARAAQIMEKLLGEIARSQARFAVLDLTGVDAVDALTLEHLLRVARAASLLGSRCLISGISPQVARAIVELGGDTRCFETFGGLQDALRHALLVSGARLPGALGS